MGAIISNNKTSSALVSTVVWLLLLGAIGSVSYQAYLNNQSGVIFYVLILVISVVMICKLILGAVYLDKEFVEARSIIRSIREKKGLYEVVNSQSHSGLFASHIRSLERISQVHHKVEQDNLLENMHTTLRFRIRDVNIFASILVTLGLVGTIVGLIIMMEDLTLAIQNIKQDSGGLLQNLLGSEGPLAGLGLAFHTTLLGSLCGGIILRILASVMDSQITKYVAYVLEMTEIYILPALRKNAENSGKEGRNET